MPFARAARIARSCATMLLFATQLAFGQTSSAKIEHPPDPQRRGIYFGYEDTRNCVERVREPTAEWSGRAPEITWSGVCVDGVREGAGLLKLYQGRLLTVALAGSYVDGYRIGNWRWEFPDGRKLEAQFRGDAREPSMRVVESARGERQLQRLSGGVYRDEPGVAPEPDRRAIKSAPPASSGPVKPALGQGEGAVYAAALIRSTHCAGKSRIEPRSDFLATRRDVDRFVREGEMAVREEVVLEIATALRAEFALNARILAYAASPSFMSDSLRERLQSIGDRRRWVACHQQSGLPYLARMLQAVPVCERALMFRLEPVRAEGNTRLQAEFADCIHGDIHSARWPQ